MTIWYELSVFIAALCLAYGEVCVALEFRSCILYIEASTSVSSLSCVWGQILLACVAPCSKLGSIR